MFRQGPLQIKEEVGEEGGEDGGDGDGGVDGSEDEELTVLDWPAYLAEVGGTPAPPGIPFWIILEGFGSLD